MNNQEFAFVSVLVSVLAICASTLAILAPHAAWIVVLIITAPTLLMVIFAAILRKVYEE